MNKESFLEKLKEYWTIYWTMFVIGICTFGGGYAMTAIIQRELGEKKKWIDEDELLDYIAISQITPGVIAVNVSTFVGRKKKGIPGAIAATVGVVSPSIIIIMIIAAVLTNFADNEYVKHAFAGIRVCVIALIVNAVIGFVKKTIVDWLTLLVFLGVFAVAAFTNFGTVYIVLCVIVLGVIITVIQSGHPIPGVKMQGIGDKKTACDKAEESKNPESAQKIPENNAAEAVKSEIQNKDEGFRSAKKIQENKAVQGVKTEAENKDTKPENKEEEAEQ